MIYDIMHGEHVALPTHLQRIIISAETTVALKIAKRCYYVPVSKLSIFNYNKPSEVRVGHGPTKSIDNGCMHVPTFVNVKSIR